MLKIVDLYADWCMPCKAQKPILEELELMYENEDVVIDRINVDGNSAQTEYYEIKSIPTLIFIKDGVQVEKLIGLQSKDQLIKLIEQYK